MEAIKSLLARLFIFLFTALFIYPAILFAFLVLGFTSSWKSGVFMLVSALLLLFVLKREAAAIPPGHWRKGRSKGKIARKSPAAQQLSRFPGEYDLEASPPHLSDIYFDIAARMKEQEELLKLLKKQDEGSGGKQDAAFGAKQDSAFGGKQDSAFGGKQDSAFGGKQDSAFGAKQDAAFGAKRDVAFGGKQDSAFGAKRDSAFGAKRDAAFGAKQDSTSSTKRDATFGAGSKHPEGCKCTVCRPTRRSAI